MMTKDVPVYAEPVVSFMQFYPRIFYSLSNPFVKLSDVERKPLDILSDQSETEVYCLSDPSELVSDLTVTLSNVNQNVP